MISRCIRAALLIAFWPAAALAFDTVDTLPWPSAGRFYPTYEGDPVRPWSVFAYGGAMYDSNVRRVSAGETSDIISRLGVGGRYTARVVGRQSIAVDGFGEYRSYDTLDEFNHFAYGLRGQWLWELGNDLAGVATLSQDRRLADVAETGSEKDLITATRAEVGGAYRFHPEWRLTGGVGTTRVTHDGRPAEPTSTTGLRGGIEYVSGLRNAVGLEWRYADGEAPVDEAVAPQGIAEYDESEIAATIAYALGEQLRLRGRIGRTERTYRDLSFADFSGTTGRGAVDWLPAAKLILTFEVYRVPDPVADTTALYVDRRGAVVRVSWAATYKVVLTVSATNERRLFSEDPLAPLGTPPRDETARTIGFGLGWEPERRWQFSTSLDMGTRESNFLGRDYDYTAIVANLRYQF